MKIYLSPFSLTPKVRLNRTSGPGLHHGFFLMAEDELGVKYSEYFPHVGLGDQSHLEFQHTFPDPLNSYHMKILTQLRGPKLRLSQVRFKNHELWRPGLPVHSPVIKYKLAHEQDFAFLEPLRVQTRVRLDANGLFNNHSFKKFISAVPEELLSFIDYIEDPTASLDWSEITLPRARDFVPGKPFEFTVYKPNRSQLPPAGEKIIFSGNMGHTLGTLLAYEELVTTGDLQEIHGLLTPDLFEEEDTNLFLGSYSESFSVNLERARSLLRDLEKRDWSALCTI